MVFRAGLGGWPARCAPHAGEDGGDAGSPGRRAERGGVPGAPALGIPHPGGAGREPGDGGVSAQLCPGGAGRPAGLVRQALQPQRRSVHHPHGRAAAGGQRSHPPFHRHELRPQRVRLRKPRQCHHRPGGAAGAPQCGRRHSGGPGQEHPGTSGQVHLLHRGKRGGQPLGSLSRGTRARKGGEHRVRHRQRAAPLGDQSRCQRPRGRARLHRIGHEHLCPQQRRLLGIVHCGDRPGTRGHHFRQGLEPRGRGQLPVDERGQHLRGDQLQPPLRKGLQPQPAPLVPPRTRLPHTGGALPG